MKYAFFTFLLTLALSVNLNNSYAQAHADPGVSGFDITDMFFVSVPADQCPQNAALYLRLPVFNSDQDNPVPAGAIKIQIELGSKFVPDYPVMTLPLITSLPMFTWTANNTSGTWQVEGVLNSALPGDFNGIADIKIKGTILGPSTVGVNLLNINTGPITFVDDGALNNFASLNYTVIEVTPVKFKGLDVLKSGCNVKVNFYTENELNVDHFEIEASKDGTHFVKVGQAAANGSPVYKSDFALTSQLSTDKLFVRIKSVDKDGHVQYSDFKTVSGICGKALEMNIYPNPVTDNNKVVINATQGLFNGKYKVSIRDFAGKLMQVKQVDLNNATRFDCEIGNLAKGKYIVQVVNDNGAESAVLQMQKL